MIEELVRFGR